MNIKRAKFSYCENEEGKTIQKVVMDNGYSWESNYSSESELIKNIFEPFTNMNIDLGEGQFIKTFIDGYREPESAFEIMFNQKNNNNKMNFIKTSDGAIIENEIDENGNKIRTQVYEKVSDTFMEYDDNNNMVTSEIWDSRNGNDMFIGAYSRNNEYDKENRIIFEEEAHYDDHEERKWYENNGHQFLKEKYYLNNR